MAQNTIVLFYLITVTCNCQIADYFIPTITKTTRELSNEVLKDPVVNLASLAYGNAVATAVDMMTRVPLAFAKGLGSIDVPKLVSSTNNVEYVDSFVADFNASKSNEDAYLNFEALVVKYGHRVEKHDVITEDGYILKVFRIPNNGTAVFLMHGLLGSADDYIIAGPDTGLAYLLAREGYDVWLGNARGNKHSRRHTRYQPSDALFWNFSFHEIGIYDLPGMIDYALKKIDQKSIKYIGHSQGTTSFFVMASERPEYNEKISLMVALSPVAFMSKVKSPIVRMLAPGTYILGGIFKSIGLYEFAPDNNLMRGLKLVMCGTGALAEVLCSNTLFLTVGFDLAQLNVTNLPVLYGHIPAGASTKQFLHYGQGVISGDFRKFDYGGAANLEKYGGVTPLSYDLSNVVAPVALFYSDEDWLAHPSDVNKLRSRLSNVLDVYNVPYEQFNHLDFVFAKDFKTLIYERLQKLLLASEYN